MCYDNRIIKCWTYWSVRLAFNPWNLNFYFDAWNNTLAWSFKIIDDVEQIFDDVEQYSKCGIIN